MPRRERQSSARGSISPAVVGPARRVVHLLAHGSLAGTEMCASLLAEAQQAAGDRPTVVLLGSGGPIQDRLEKAGVPCVRIGARGGCDVAAGIRLARLLRRIQPTIVHAHDLFCWSSLVTAAIHRGPRIVTLHNHIPAGGWTRPILRAHRVARLCHTHFVGVSEATLRSVAQAVGLPRDRCSVIPNGIPIATFKVGHDREVIRAGYGCRPDDLIVGVVGRQTALKGMNDFLRTAAAMLRREPRVRFWIVGSGEDLPRHASLARSLGIGDWVTFWGDRTDLPSLYAAMDLYLVTSRWESFGLAVLEAMAAGVPILGFVPDEGGLGELVQNHRTGILLETRDPEQLAILAIHVLRDPSRRTELAKAGQVHVAGQFDISRTVEAYGALYRRLLARPGPPPQFPQAVNRPRTGLPAGGRPVDGENEGGCIGDQDDPAAGVRCSIVIPTYKRPGYLRNCLNALTAQTRIPEEVVLVVRPEDKDSMAVVQSFQAVGWACELRMVFVLEPGIVQAENRGVAAARGDILVFLDDDAAPPSWWLGGLLAHFGDPSVGGVGGPVIPVVAGVPRHRRAWFSNRLLFPGLILDSSTRVGRRVTDVDHLRGANMSFRRHLIGRIGGFDVRLIGDQFRWELDACLAVRSLGYRLRFDPTLWVHHFEAPRLAEGVDRYAPETVYRNAYNESYVLLKHTPAAMRPLVILASLLVGSLSAPGLVLALASPVMRRLVGSRHALSLDLLGSSIRGKWAGLRTWGRGT